MRSAPFFLLFAMVFVGLASGRAAAGNQASIVQQTGKDLFVAGRDVSIDSRIQGDLTATAVSVTISPDSKIGGDAWIAGKRVAVQGEIGGNLDLRAQEALINGHIKGSVSFAGEKLSLGPEAVIDGDLSYLAASDADVDPAARIGGEIDQQFMGYGGRVDAPPAPREDGVPPSAEDGNGGLHSWQRHQEWRYERGMYTPGYRMSVPGAILLGILAGLISFGAPEWARSVQRAIAEAPAGVFLFGIGWLVGVPIAVIVTALSVIGIPLAFLLLAAYVAMIVAALVAAILIVGGWVVERFRKPEPPDTRPNIMVAVVGVILLWVAVSVPLIGGILWLVAVTGGAGAILMSGRRRYFD